MFQYQEQLMSTQTKQSYFTPEEYLELERNSLHKQGEHYDLHEQNLSRYNS